jgi:hypothetical protein
MVMPMKEPVTKNCERCGTLMIQPRWANGKLDATFAARKYCSVTCAGYRETTKKSAGRKRAQRAIPEMTKCNRCPETSDLQRHHVDRNPMNNDPSNLEVLCQTCHAAEHASDGTWGKGAVEIATCRVCSTNFQPKRSRRSTLCSAECKKEWGRICARRRWGEKTEQHSPYSQMNESEVA